MKGKESEILKVLMENKDKELNINQIARILNKDYKNVHNIITRLSKMHLVKLQEFGRAHKVVLLNKIHPLILEAEYNRRGELLKNKNLLIMYDSFKEINTKLYILLVFGSYAKKTQTKHSDIDIMFIVPDSIEEKMEKEINRVVNILPLKIHVNIFKESDFIAMKNSKETTVGSETIKNNVILHGVEAYYELMEQ